MSSGFKKVTNRGQIRKRQHQSSSSDDSEEESSAVPEQWKSKKQSRGLQQSTSRKVNKVDAPVSSSSDENESSTIIGDSYKSSRSGKSNAPVDMGATSIIEVDTQQDRDAQAIIDKHLKAQESEEKTSGPNVPFYKGQHLHQDSLKRNQRYGPQRAPLNIRATTRWDYAPDICKDYKETGVCGFGDSCKFLHDRSDYKFGWQLEAETERNSYDNDDPSKYEIHEDEETVPSDDFPEACWVCRGPFKDPVMTRCEHYFCETCFLKEVVPQKRCPVCSRLTEGYAQVAKKLRQSLQRKATA